MGILKKVIFSGFNNERGPVIDHLRAKYGWEPVFLIGRQQERAWAEANYGNAVFVDLMELRLSHFDYFKIGPGVPIDRKIIRDLSSYESGCLYLMEDTTGWNFSFEERRRFYYDTLRYWNTVIHHLKPDIFVSWVCPHAYTDYVLYLLCKHCYKIPTVFSDSTPYVGNYNAFHNELEDLPGIFEDACRLAQGSDLSPEVRAYLAGIRAKRGEDPKHITAYNKEYQYSYFRAIARLIKKIPFVFRKQDVAFKHNKHPFGSSKAQMNFLQYDLWQLQVMIKNKWVYKIYASYAKKPDLNKKYILFPASYQPEATTCPQAGAYDDLILILDLLSASLPEGWVIYYKEYPERHLQTYHKLSLARNKPYYERIASLKNVQMIPSEMDTSELIDHAQAVATPTGTVGWEAVVRGKPVLIFGSVWYGGCKSIFKIEAFQDCVDAIDKIKNGYKPDQADVERYAAAIERTSHKLFNHPRDLRRLIGPSSDKEYEIGQIAQAFHDAYERY